MRIQGCISSTTYKLRYFSPLDMLFIMIDKLFGQSEVNSVYSHTILASTEAKVGRLNVSMNHTTTMNVFKHVQHLQTQKEHGS